MPRIAIFQMTSGIDPSVNSRAILDALNAAKRGGAEMLFAPEMCGLLDRDRSRSLAHIVSEESNLVLNQVRAACAGLGIWCALGSLPVAAPSGKSANRSFVIDANGKVAARYDKIHMFDVDLATGESWRESSAYEPGTAAVSVETPIGRAGLTVCYDIRFPALFEILGRDNCDILLSPAAFTVPTGKAHWHTLLRARAIEASAFVIAAAQTGLHADGRETFGHSLVVDPWGDVLLDMGTEPGVGFVDIDLARIAQVRAQLPSLANRRDISRSKQS